MKIKKMKRKDIEDNSFSALADVIMGKMICSKCKKKTVISASYNIKTALCTKQRRLSACCEAPIERIMVGDSRFDSL